jgi:predicted hotdog family 3-hydroxylacyl-ACP dehydratase
MAQAMAALNGHDLIRRGEPVRLGFLAGARDFQASHAFIPCGTRLRISVERILRMEDGLGLFECNLTSLDDRFPDLTCSATISAFAPADPDRYFEDSRRHESNAKPQAS